MQRQCVRAQLYGGNLAGGRIKRGGSIRRIRRRPHPYPSPPAATAVRGRLRGSSGTRSGLWPSVVHRLDCSLILFPSFSVAPSPLPSSPNTNRRIELILRLTLKRFEGFAFFSNGKAKRSLVNSGYFHIIRIIS